MKDYRAKFNNTKHFEKAIDVAYDSDKEYIRFLKQQLEAKDKVIEAFLKLDIDNHYWGVRPCPTCQKIAELLGKQFGCNRIVNEYKEVIK